MTKGEGMGGWSGFCMWPGHLDTGHEFCKNTEGRCPCPCHEKEEK
jgi:hypothetical protein